MTEHINQDVRTGDDILETHPLRYEHHFAGFWIRFWAYLLDILIINSIYSIIGKPIAMNLPFDGWSWLSIETVVHSLIFYLYFILQTKLMGQTLGKMAFGLRVIRSDENPLSWQDCIFREWVGRYISATLWVLYIVVAFIPRKRGLHDLFADTFVIHEETVKRTKGTVPAST